MPWSDLAFQFCMELAFGVLLALAFVPKAPVGTMFYRVMGTSALVPVLAGLGISLSVGSLAPSSPIVVAGALVVLTYPIYSGPVRGARWAFGLGLAVLGCVVAVTLTIRAAAPELGVLQLALAATTALATGAVAGSVGLAMVLGHWYLTVPNLQIGHLRRLNRVTVLFFSLLAIGFLIATFDVRSDGDSVANVMREGTQSIFTPLQKGVDWVASPAIAFVDGVVSEHPCDALGVVHPPLSRQGGPLLSGQRDERTRRWCCTS